VKVFGQVVRMPSSVRAMLPEAAKTLEQAWQRRRQELVSWLPAKRWLVSRSPKGRSQSQQP